MKIEIRWIEIVHKWTWSCPVCHFGRNIPWEEEVCWQYAIEQADWHLEIHREVGQTLTWIPFL